MPATMTLADRQVVAAADPATQLLQGNESQKPAQVSDLIAAFMAEEP